MDKPKYIEDRTGTLTWYPPQDGVASAATCELYQPGGSVLKAAASATIATASTTIGANVSEGARSYTVASATGISAGDVLLVEEAGRVWHCELKSLSGTTLYPYGEVPFALTTSATVKGYKLTYALSADETADIAENYRAEWVYTIGGVEYLEDQLWDVVAADDQYQTRHRHLVSMYSWVASQLDTQDKDAHEHLRTAWELYLVPRLRQKGIHIEKVRNTQRLIPLHCAVAQEVMAYNDFMDNPDLRERWEGAQDEAQHQLDILSADSGWYDENQDLAVSDEEEHRQVVHRLVR